ncbi:MAG: hypothetical protein FWC27_02110, partial [Firmicutes bacterium]|nr:hypothetical protein [Bacillota bacterium]
SDRPPRERGGLSQPVESNFSPPPTSAPASPPSIEPPQDTSQDRLFAEWGEVIGHLRGSNPPLSGILDGSAAYIRGDYVLIKSGNPALNSFISQKSHAGNLIKAIYEVTDRRVRLGLYKAAESALPKDPLEMLAERAKDL